MAIDSRQEMWNESPFTTLQRHRAHVAARGYVDPEVIKQSNPGNERDVAKKLKDVGLQDAEITLLDTRGKIKKLAYIGRGKP